MGLLVLYFESFSHSANSSKGHPWSPEPLGPRPSSLSPGATQTLPWCSSSASSLSVPLSECRSAEAIHQGWATALLRRRKQSECLSSLRLEASRAPLSTFAGNRAPGRPSWELPEGAHAPDHMLEWSWCASNTTSLERMACAMPWQAGHLRETRQGPRGSAGGFPVPSFSVLPGHPLEPEEESSMCYLINIWKIRPPLAPIRKGPFVFITNLLYAAAVHKEMLGAIAVASVAEARLICCPRHLSVFRDHPQGKGPSLGCSWLGSQSKQVPQSIRSRDLEKGGPLALASSSYTFPALAAL